MDEELKYKMFQLKGLADMLEVDFEIDDNVHYEKFQVIHNLINEMVKTIKK